MQASCPSSVPDDCDTMEGTIYTSYNIATHPDLRLTHDDLVFVALLAKGDYAVCECYITLI